MTSRPKIVNYCQPGVQAPRMKIPKDGAGPRGFPDCYYVSRVSHSTFRYAKFVKRLRAAEEEQRIGDLGKLKLLKDIQSNEFFIRCDRRSLIQNVSRRVDLCMQSYQQDLEDKRQRLIALFAEEEKDTITKFVLQAQEGADLVWQDKMDRLNYLIAKRQKEHEEKYKEPPIAKAVHVHPCIRAIREKECQQILQYQMKEKQARKMADIETDKMWHEVVMKEADALAARMEVDAMDRYRRDMACKHSTDLQLQQKAEQRQMEKERLKREQLMLKSIWEEDNKKEEEKIRQEYEKKMQAAEDRRVMLEEKKALDVKRALEKEQIDKTWASLTGQGLADEQAKLDLMRRKERELDICNAKLTELHKDRALQDEADEQILNAEAKRRQDVVDKRRCEYLLWSRKTNADVRKAMIEQIQEHKDAKEKLKQKLAEENAYQEQLAAQTAQLVDLKMQRSKNSDYLQHQIEYNKLLQERAKLEEKEQLEKFKKATQDYKDEMKRMVCRPFFSEEIHPFMKQMAVNKLTMKPKCPCSKPDYCK